MEAREVVVKEEAAMVGEQAVVETEAVKLVEVATEVGIA